MTIPEAASLVIQAGAIGGRGEVFVLDMGEPVRILDLAKQMIRLSGKEPDRDIVIEIVGTRPGEKLHEELWGEGETAEATTHPKIMRVSGPTVDAVWLQDELAELERLVREGETLEVVSRLATMMRAPRLRRRDPCARRHGFGTDADLEPSAAAARVARWTILDGLNPEQRRAAEAVRGPVCILAGAGSGKTTTITRRIAWQVATGAFRSDELLAVTFTDKAAGEMRARLARLGVDGVEARTFHSAALAQLRRARGEGRGGSSPPRRSCCARSATRCLARSASGRPATSRPRSSGPRTGG